MLTGAEVINFKSFNSQNKQSISDFEKLKSREIGDVVNTNNDIFDTNANSDSNIESEVIDSTNMNFDEIDDSTPPNDDLSISGGSHIQKYNSLPYGIGKEPSLNKNNNLPTIKKYSQFIKDK